MNLYIGIYIYNTLLISKCPVALTKATHDEATGESAAGRATRLLFRGSNGGSPHVWKPRYIYIGICIYIYTHTGYVYYIILYYIILYMID